uniref:Uncharacterized protein n=1 Tax=Onchocerca volvulus TaxID=6282 RepID=A0A8R1TSI7_ONCVO
MGTSVSYFIILKDTDDFKEMKRVLLFQKALRHIYYTNGEVKVCKETLGSQPDTSQKMDAAGTDIPLYSNCLVNFSTGPIVAEFRYRNLFPTNFADRWNFLLQKKFIRNSLLRIGFEIDLAMISDSDHSSHNLFHVCNEHYAEEMFSVIQRLNWLIKKKNKGCSMNTEAFNFATCGAISNSLLNPLLNRALCISSILQPELGLSSRGSLR